MHRMPYLAMRERVRDSEGEIMNRPRFLVLAAVLTAVVPFPRIDRAAGQEVALTPLEATEVARGYRAEAIKLKPVVNDKNETIGRINDFIIGKDGNIYVVLAVGDFTGLSGHLIAIPFRSLKLDDPSGNIVVPGASRAALEKLPVYVTKR
jgi:PRC-barrel domain protein